MGVRATSRGTPGTQATPWTPPPRRIPRGRCLAVTLRAPQSPPVARPVRTAECHPGGGMRELVGSLAGGGGATDAARTHLDSHQHVRAAQLQPGGATRLPTHQPAVRVWRPTTNEGRAAVAPRRDSVHRGDTHAVAQAPSPACPSAGQQQRTCGMRLDCNTIGRKSRRLRPSLRTSCSRPSSTYRRSAVDSRSPITRVSHSPS